MPIPLPNLDDRTFADLTEEARALVPVRYPDWTDHNPSDPGIVLVELLAWLTEMLLFQVNQIPEANTRKFLELLNGPTWSPPAAGGLDGGGLDAAIRQTMHDLHERYRAVTPDDYEYLVREVWPRSPEAAGMAALARVRCIPGRDLTAADPAAPAPAHVSVVVVPQVVPAQVVTAQVVPAQAAMTRGSARDSYPQPTAALTTALSRFLAPRRILTTRHHVVGPSYVDVGIAAHLALHEDALPDEAFAQVRDKLTAFCDPLHGGAARDGWPFGQDVYVSEVYAVLEQASLIDYVEQVRLTGPKPIPDSSGQVIGIELDAHQLVRLTRLDLVGYDSYGRSHPQSGTVAS
ncbi:MAG: hypothetical protein ACRDTF_08145 [Pseudonocardiaceae bacterium]